MKTSFPDIITTEKYLRRELDGQETLLFKARLLVSEEWRANTYFQKMVYRLVHIYHRRKIKAQVNAVHERLLKDPAKASFSTEVLSFFKH